MLSLLRTDSFHKEKAGTIAPERTTRQAAWLACGLILVLALWAGCKPTPRADEEGGKTASADQKEAIPAKVDASLPAGPRWESQVYRLRIRNAPKKDAAIVGHLAKGEIVVELEKSPKTVTVSGKQGRWIKVQTQAKTTGWVFSAFLTQR